VPTRTARRTDRRAGGPDRAREREAEADNSRSDKEAYRWS
jgi:hypothetical protein